MYWLYLRLRDRFGTGRGGERIVQLFVAALLVLLSLSNLWVTAGDISAYNTGLAPGYIRHEFLDAFRWLKENTDPSQAVLSSIQTGSFIPAQGGNRVFLGHTELTVGVRLKMKLVEAFFAENTNDDVKWRLLDGAGIDYVFLSSVERQLGAFRPEEKDYLRRVYANDLVSIYRVVRDRE
jgi:hypothetical protein